MRYQSNGCAFMLLMRGGNAEREVLLQLRKNTGYMDGKYDASASGHLEPGETLESCAIRETFEEIGVKLRPEDVKFGMLNHAYHENYIRAVFYAELPEGQIPRICESDKSGDLRWFKLNEMPENTVPFLPNAIKCIERGIYYDDNDFSVLSRISKT